MAGSRTVFKAASLYVDAYNNIDYNVDENGEANVVRKLSQLPLHTVFDVGANRGDWGRLVIENSPANVHCFEIAEPTFKKLKDSLGSEPRCRLNNIGLGSRDTAVTLDYYPENDTVTTSILGKQIHKQERIALEGRLIRGDDYCATAKVQAIDLLKIDVEGSENEVLAGFETMIADGRIKVIQFEYGMANIYTRFLLRDYYELLEAHDFAVGKIYPDFVDFGRYDPRQEDFRGPNYLAVNGKYREIIELLRH